MKNKFIRFLKSRTFITIAASVAVIAVAAVAAAKLGLLSDKITAKALKPQKDTAIYTLTNPDITAKESDSLGVSPTSAFRLKFSGHADEDSLKEALSVKPEQTFKLKKVNSNEYDLVFDQPLETDSIYQFILSDKKTGEKKSWAFQTKKSVNVLRTLPRDKAIQVPVNSGIEITFNCKGIQDPEDYFEITPQVKGRFEQHGETLVFVPEGLKEATIYTVKVRNGLGINGSNEKLSNDYSFSFQTEIPENTKDAPYFCFIQNMYTVSPKKIPALQIYTEDSLMDKDVTVQLFTYPDADSFLTDLKASVKTPYWALSSNNDVIYDESKLVQASSVKAKIVSEQDSFWNNTFLLLPDTLPDGYYLVKVDIEGEYYYAQLQVNAAAVYLMVTQNKTLAWVNDSVTGAPIKDAEVTINGANSSRTDESGIAVLKNEVKESSDTGYSFFTIKPENMLPYVAQTNSSSQYYYDNRYYYGSAANAVDDYWSYMYLDKSIYLPTDTVNIWGIVKPRSGRMTKNEARLELVRYDYYRYGDDASVLSSKKVNISPGGTFSGSLNIANYNPGSYNVRLVMGNGDVIMQQYLRVIDYTKPAYKIDITSDHKYMYAWETNNFNINAAFFEGTPASGIKLDYNCYVGGKTIKQGQLISDDAGSSALSVVPDSGEEGWRPVSMGLSVSNSEAEEQQINAYSYVQVFPKDTMVEVNSTVDGSTVTAEILTNKIDLTKLNSKADYYTQDEYRGAPVDINVNATLYESHYEKKVIGTYYDYINKVTREKYEYYEVKNVVNKYGFTTVNGKHEISFTADKDKWYYLEISCKDSAGRSITETEYLNTWGSYIVYDDTYEIEPGNTKYKLNEKVNVNITYNGEKAPSGNKYLYIRLMNGILDFTAVNDPSYSFNYDESLIPNMYVKAVCFDGTNLHDIDMRRYLYDSSEKQLDINVSADKDSYKPGDTVKLSFDVKGSDGKPRSSEINVSVVDEALFSLWPQSVDILSGLYSPSVSSGILSEYITSEDSRTDNGMAEGGEGGDAYTRSDFKDSALFTAVTSGSDGKAEVTFKLPDNLTSWRVTYQAVTDKLEAGNGKINVSSRLPFFVDTIFNKVFITGDTPSIIVRAYGTELDSDAQVSYKIRLDNGTSTKEYTAAGKANTNTEIALDSLSAGKYTITVDGTSGKLFDSMKKSFTVSDSLLETSKTDYITLSDATTLKSSTKGLTSIIFFGEESSLLYNELNSLYCSWGQRLDQKLAVKISGELLQKYFGEDIYTDNDFDISSYQTADGGFALLTYDSSSPELSAKMCSLAADYVDTAALASYFRSILDNEDSPAEDIANAYWGLASLHEPVLLDIRELLNDNSLTMQQRLTLGMALAEIGDYRGARDIYDTVMKKTGTVNDTLAWVTAGTRDESIDATSLCSLIALKTNAPEKLKLFNYIKSNSTSELIVNMERMMFVKNIIKNAGLDNSFTYEIDGVKKNVELKNGGYYRLTVTPDMLGKLKFSNINGNVLAAVSYVAPVSEAYASKDGIVSIKREYSTDNKTSEAFRRSDLIKVTITPSFSESAPDGYYEITDILPAGFRYVRCDSRREEYCWYPDEVTGQKVVFGYYYDKNGKNEKSITYYCRAAIPGTYTADNAAIRHSGSNITGFTDRSFVTVGN